HARKAEVEQSDLRTPARRIALSNGGAVEGDAILLAIGPRDRDTPFTTRPIRRAGRRQEINLPPALNRKCGSPLGMRVCLTVEGEQPIRSATLRMSMGGPSFM